MGRASQQSTNVPLPSWATYNVSPDTDEMDETTKTEGMGDAAGAGDPTDVDEEDSLRVESLSAQDSDALVTFMDDLGDIERDM